MLRPRFRLYVAPTSKDHVQPSSGCRQRGDRTNLKHRHCSIALSPTRHPPHTPLLYQNKSPSAEQQRCGSVFVDAKHQQARLRFNPARDADKGAISLQTSLLPSDSLSYPSPNQDPVAPPKRVVVGRTAALWPRFRPCLTPASKTQVQPSSGCRQGGRFDLKTRHCPLSLSPTRRPPKTRCSTKTSRRRSYDRTTAPSSFVPNTCKQQSG